MANKKHYNIHTSINLYNNFIVNGLVDEPVKGLHITNKDYVDKYTTLFDVMYDTPLVSVGGIIAGQTIVKDKRLVEIIKQILYPNLITGYDELKIEFTDSKGNPVDGYNVIGFIETKIQLYCNIIIGDRTIPAEIKIETRSNDPNVSEISLIENGKAKPVLNSCVIQSDKAFIILSIDVLGLSVPKHDSFGNDIPIPDEFKNPKKLEFDVPYKLIRPIFYEITNKGRESNDLDLLPISYDSLKDNYSIAGNIEEYKISKGIVSYKMNIRNDNPKVITIFIPTSLNYSPELILKDANNTNILKLFGLKKKEFVFNTTGTYIASYMGYQFDLTNYHLGQELDLIAIYKNNHSDDGDFGSFDSLSFDKSYF